jgi:general secretion pathway protein J
LDSDAAAGAFGRTLLLEGVDAFQILYFGAVDGETEPDWQVDWIDRGALPSLVRIRLTTLGQSWPDLIVAFPDQQP